MRISSPLRTALRAFARRPARSAPRPSIGAPKAVAPDAMQKVRSLGRGVEADQLWDRLAGQPAPHVDAILNAFARGQRVMDRKGRRETIPWAQVHLMHVQFAPGTRSVDAAKLPVGARGAQLGAAHCVRGHKGHVHAYAMVWLPEAPRR